MDPRARSPGLSPCRSVFGGECSWHGATTPNAEGEIHHQGLGRDKTEERKSQLPEIKRQPGASKMRRSCQLPTSAMMQRRGLCSPGKDPRPGALPGKGGGTSALSSSLPLSTSPSRRGGAGVSIESLSTTNCDVRPSTGRRGQGQRFWGSGSLGSDPGPGTCCVIFNDLPNLYEPRFPTGRILMPLRRTVLKTNDDPFCNESGT